MWLKGSSLSFFLPSFICKRGVPVILDSCWFGILTEKTKTKIVIFFQEPFKKEPKWVFFCFQIYKSRLQTGIQTSHWTRCHKIWVTKIKFILVSIFLLELSWLCLLLFAHSFYPKTKERTKFKVLDRCEVWEKPWNPITHDGEEGLGKKRNAVWSAGWGLGRCSMGVLLSTSLGPSVTASWPYILFQ